MKNSEKLTLVLFSCTTLFILGAIFSNEYYQQTSCISWAMGFCLLTVLTRVKVKK